MNIKFDTIVAPATPMVASAVGILRLSGPDADKVAQQVFFPAGKPLSQVPNRLMIRGQLRDASGHVFDHGMACVMRAPRSYTGETVVELYLHGSPAVMTQGLALLYAAGARPALAGEFTRRAVYHGKLDLLQAEGVADLIDARTTAAARNAAGQIDGSISRQIQQVWALVTGVLAQVSACVDYPEDDIPDITTQQILEGLSEASKLLSLLVDSYERGKLLKDGIAIAIVGRPNAGKSSLFNALLGVDRAIVTPIPGTTRDSIEGSITFEGRCLRLQDTAGIHQTDNPIEAEGIRRAKALIDSAGLVLVVIDSTQPLTGEDRDILALGGDKPQLVVLNKADLGTMSDGLPQGFSVSAKTGAGLTALLSAVTDLVGPLAEDEVLVTNVRHARGMAAAKEAIDETRAALMRGVPADVALGVLDSALATLNELTGKSVNEAVLEQVFANFCVGK